MNSIATGRALFQILSPNERLQSLISDKIFPLKEETGTTYPFIVYRRDSVTPASTKDLTFEDAVSISIACIGNSYKEVVEIASTVREILEGKKFPAFDITGVTLDAAHEDYMDDAFVQILEFTLTIEN